MHAGWTCSRQMACKRSGVRISLPPLVKSIIRTIRTGIVAGKYSNGGPLGAANARAAPDEPVRRRVGQCAAPRWARGCAAAQPSASVGALLRHARDMAQHGAGISPGGQPQRTVGSPNRPAAGLYRDASCRPCLPRWSSAAARSPASAASITAADTDGKPRWPAHKRKRREFA